MVYTVIHSFKITCFLVILREQNFYSYTILSFSSFDLQTILQDLNTSRFPAQVKIQLMTLPSSFVKLRVKVVAKNYIK